MRFNRKSLIWFTWNFIAFAFAKYGNSVYDLLHCETLKQAEHKIADLFSKSNGPFFNEMLKIIVKCFHKRYLLFKKSLPYIEHPHIIGTFVSRSFMEMILQFDNSDFNYICEMIDRFIRF